MGQIATVINPTTLWFNTLDTFSLCRGGGNGSNHPSQLYAIKKYVKSGMSFLDYGAGSGTTCEAIMKNYSSMPFHYLGVDIIPKNVDWCAKHFPDCRFSINPTIHKIDEADKSWDVVYSRHVVDHMKNFEEALDEHCRVASKLVIIVLWRHLEDKSSHDIRNIVENGKLYENEFTNNYSKPLVLKAIEAKEKSGWKLLELTEGVGKEVKGFDIVIVLKRNE